MNNILFRNVIGGKLFLNIKEFRTIFTQIEEEREAGLESGQSTQLLIMFCRREVGLQFTVSLYDYGS